MKPSERNAKNDKATAWMMTILIHGALLAALWLVGMPSKSDQPLKKDNLEQKAIQGQSPKPRA